MKNKELTFAEAWEYILYLIDKGFSIKGVADSIGASRNVVSAAINGQIEPSTGKPRKLPESYHSEIINLAELLQLESWRKEIKKNDS